MIPAFTVSSVLPPFIGHDPAVRADMAPYSVAMSEVAGRFATSDERIRILTGLMDYRDRLKAAGIADGFQWLGGSFVESCEMSRGRPPNDIDIVTFSRLPVTSSADKRTLLTGYLDLFDTDQVKRNFVCDAYFVDLDKDPKLLVDDARYWFGLFSHQRVTALWKGLLQVKLSCDDDLARTLL